MPTLLPNNATELESSMDIVAAERLAIDIPIKDYQDPYLCPVNLLPWLAWERGVVYWNSDWPEATKRQVIAEAPAINRIKGTKAAVLKALRALNINAIYRNASEYGGELGTFELSALVHENLAGGGSLLGGEQLLELQRIVNEVKRASFHYEINLGFEYQSPLSAPAALSQPSVMIEQSFKGPELPEFNTETPIAAAAALSGPVVLMNINFTETAHA